MWIHPVQADSQLYRVEPLSPTLFSNGRSGSGGPMKREVGTPRNGAYLVEAVADPLRLNGDQTHKERHGRMRPRLRGGLKT